MALKSESSEALLRQLKDPFDPSLVKWRSGGSNRMLAYVDARDVMKRLDSVLGAANYQTHYTSTEGGFICELMVRIDGEWVTRSDGANYTKVEPIKGGISGALKRAANAWGIGRYLYYMNPAKYNEDNVDEWPEYFKPGNKVEKWEDIAELEYSLGMDDEEDVTAVIATADTIRGITTFEELEMVQNAMDAADQQKFAEEFRKKVLELKAKQDKEANGKSTSTADAGSSPAA